MRGKCILYKQFFHQSYSKPFSGFFDCLVRILWFGTLSLFDAASFGKNLRTAEVEIWWIVQTWILTLVVFLRTSLKFLSENDWSMIGLSWQNFDGFYSEAYRSPSSSSYQSDEHTGCQPCFWHVPTWAIRFQSFGFSWWSAGCTHYIKS